MPYKAEGKWVYKKNSRGKWVPFKLHDTPEKARRHARALNINVKD